MSLFRRIGIIARLDKPQILETVKRLTDFLIAQGVEPVLEEDLATMMSGAHISAAPLKELGDRCDLVMVVGGDGSFLGAARAIIDYDVPVLGMNRGTLGFLTDISPIDFEKELEPILRGEYLEEKRFMIEAKIKRQNRPSGEGIALNDLVLHPGKSARMIRFDLFIDDQFVMNQKSDGLIVATPTGSTAYALSAGGPIMLPKLDALVLVPMHPHTLSNRPIVIDADANIRIVVCESNLTYPSVSCDGQLNITAAPGDEIHITRRKGFIRLIHPKDHDFYDVCRTKLGWQSSYRQ
ncbi:putative inorganic polyphosphate/ATP-NAD kinase [Marinomonas gallaica]|uniref:NAD kinase n=1 Tax=Marinomonas gallaica TaxID=1806667 RepID=A0A1C3JV40_9GAMM|nr:NAD(+) kinase [Marinomonas gallaica]SBT18992.1 putative inorganic polyphosphate/ATP-NAD kinase [Marinomonas gallaica]SBT21947.1 putative inorganic polyphosphate/ATP-NAD kinase [Marinomonas gallaica]